MKKLLETCLKNTVSSHKRYVQKLRIPFSTITFIGFLNMTIMVKTHEMPLLNLQ